MVRTDPRVDRCAERGIAPEQVRTDLTALCAGRIVRQVAAILGVPQSTVSAVKNGNSKPSLRLLHALYGETGTTLRPELESALSQAKAPPPRPRPRPPAAPEGSASFAEILARLEADRDAAELALDELEGEILTLKNLIARYQPASY